MVTRGSCFSVNSCSCHPKYPPLSLHFPYIWHQGQTNKAGKWNTALHSKPSVVCPPFFPDLGFIHNNMKKTTNYFFCVSLHCANLLFLITFFFFFFFMRLQRMKVKEWKCFFYVFKRIQESRHLPKSSIAVGIVYVRDLKVYCRDAPFRMFRSDHNHMKQDLSRYRSKSQ